MAPNSGTNGERDVAHRKVTQRARSAHLKGLKE